MLGTGFTLCANETLGSVYSKFIGQQQASERAHNILDLNFSLLSLTPQSNEKQRTQGLTSSTNEADEGDDSEGLSAAGARLSTLYAPRSGFFTQFEEQGGVKLFIRVTLNSLEWWKD